MDSDIRRKSLSTVKRLLKTEDTGSALVIAELFEVDENADVDDIAFYGKILLTCRQYAKARDILKLAYEKSLSHDIGRDFETAYWLDRSREDVREMRAGVALSMMMDQPDVASVLDIGAGGGEHAVEFARAGKTVDCVDLGRSVYFNKSGVPTAEKSDRIRFTVGDFADFAADQTYDLVWCSHVLEHQPNANAFLKRCLGFVTEGKWLAITVPPLKHAIVGGHVSLWNAGLLLYQLVLSGNDCSDAIVMNYNYNVSVVVRRRPVQLPELDYDSGDVDRLAAFLPDKCKEGFDGRMTCASVPV